MQIFSFIRLSFHVAILGLGLLLIPTGARAGSATWKQVPATGEWTSANNWTPATVPNGDTDVATFSSSNVVAITIAAAVEVSDIDFSAGASAYSVTPLPGISLTLSGGGITNESTLTQTFTTGGSSTGMTSITFGNNATAGTLTSFTNNSANSAGQTAGLTSFTDTASAATATIVNNGSTIAGGSPAATQFYDSSTADQASITNNGSNISGGFGAVTIFSGNATAANSVLTNNGGFGGGLGSSTMFVDNSTGALARGIARGNGSIDISGLTATGTEIGSIEGNGNFFLGSKALTVGSNGLGTLVTGVIQDGGQAGGAGGSLVKEGVSTTNLSAPNSYTGGTIIRAGTLLVSNIRGSGTGTGSVTVIRGVLGGTGTMSGLVTVGPGMGQGAVLAPGNQGVGTLNLTKMLTFSTNSFLRYEVQLDTAQADQVNAAGVTIDSGATFVFNPIRTGTLTTGTVFTVINNTSSSAIVGRFGNLRDNGVFRAGATKFRANYEGGDGNDLIITVL